jgi:hypothetical protein
MLDTGGNIPGGVGAVRLDEWRRVEAGNFAEPTPALRLRTPALPVMFTTNATFTNLTASFEISESNRQVEALANQRRKRSLVGRRKVPVLPTAFSSARYAVARAGRPDTSDRTTRTPVLASALGTSLSAQEWDLHPDRKRFVFVVNNPGARDSSQGQTRHVVILNRFAELEAALAKARK